MRKWSMIGRVAEYILYVQVYMFYLMSHVFVFLNVAPFIEFIVCQSILLSSLYSVIS